MSRDDGFAVADIDTSYFDDAKMRDLWNLLRDPDRMARAVCLHKSTLLASWRAGTRVTVTQAAPLWLPVDEALLGALREAKLLDRFGKIPADSWQTWFGTAYNRREARRVSGRAGGLVAAKRRDPSRENAPVRAQQRSSDATATPEQTDRFAVPVRPSDPTVRPTRARARDDDDDRPDLDAWLLVRRRPPTERQRAFLDAYQATFDVTPKRAERLILEHPDDPIAALKADLDEFRQRRLAEAKAAERSVPRPPRRNGGLSPLNVELAKLLRERDAAAGVAVETKS